MPKGIYKHPPQCGFQKGHKVWLGKHHTKKSRLKMGKNAACYWLGKHPSKTTLQKRSQSLKKKVKRGKNHYRWKGGITKKGKWIYLSCPDHPFANKKGYVLRSHLVMEKKIGRFLKRGEIVHHINKDSSDDRPENLMLFPSQSAHTKFHRDYLQ